MDKDVLFNLRLKRQFILTPQPITIDANFKTDKIGKNYYLKYHADLPFVSIKNKERRIIVLGNIFDPFHPEYSNSAIADKLSDLSFEQLLQSTDDYSGRYLIIYYDNLSLRLINDFMSHYKVYWTTFRGKTWCASQPHILSRYTGANLLNEEYQREFFSSQIFCECDYFDFFDITRYSNIYHLQPNHALDLYTSSIRRYWPIDEIKPKNKEQVIRNSAELLRGYLKAASIRYNLMIPVTAGFDSRVMLAASKDIRERCIYYINKNEWMNDSHPDIYIPRKLLASLGENFQVIEFPKEVDKGFKEIYIENNQTPRMERLPLIYNTYYNRFRDFLNLPGNGAEAFLYRWWRDLHNNVDARELNSILMKKEHQFSLEILDKWLNDVNILSKTLKIDISNLLYIELRMANWATNFQVNKDIAQDEFYPFNSRRLVSELLSVKPYYRQVNSKIILKEIIGLLWKEALDLPFNPTFSHQLKYAMEKIGIYNTLRGIGSSV